MNKRGKNHCTTRTIAIQREFQKQSPSVDLFYNFSPVCKVLTNSTS